MIKKTTYIFLACLLLLASCEDYYDTKNNPVTYGDTYLNIGITTDKAAYSPGETVRFTLKEKPSGNLKVRYSHLGQVLKEENLPGTTWSWAPPADDFKGYMVDIYEAAGDGERILQSIAVDVSSDWTKFPRYGFLSSYGDMSNEQIARNIETLNRYRINGIQFYDWMHDHHRPLAGTAENPLASWPDLIGRPNYLSTVKGYIDAAHDKGMKTMFYNLAFGALDNAASDGVKEEWYIFRDAHGSEMNDSFFDDNGKIGTRTNNSGGIQAGISNGQDIYFRVAFKPVSTILREQQTVDIHGNDTVIKARGRHDPCVLPRAVPIVEAMAAMVIIDYYLLAKAK